VIYFSLKKIDINKNGIEKRIIILIIKTNLSNLIIKKHFV